MKVCLCDPGRSTVNHASQEVEVVLSGVGSEELFSGIMNDSGEMNYGNCMQKRRLKFCPHTSQGLDSKLRMITMEQIASPTQMARCHVDKKCRSRYLNLGVEP